MRLESLACKNLIRCRRRNSFLLLGMVLAATTVVTLYTFTRAVNTELANTFDAIGPNIIVYPGHQGFSYGGVVLPVKGEGEFLPNEAVIAVKNIRQQDNIARVAPKALGLAEIKGKRLAVVGVDFPAEFALKKWWRYQGRRPEGKDDALLGGKVARELEKAPGDLLAVNGRMLKVAAVLEEQGTEEDGLIFMNLFTAQELTGIPGLSFIEVAAYCTTCPIETIMAQIRTALPETRVTALAEAVKAREAVIGRLNTFTYGVGAVILVLGGLIVFFSTTAQVRQRVREIGLLRAAGYRRRHILEIILTEVLLLGLVGGGISYFLGINLARSLVPALTGMDLVITEDYLLAGTSLLLAAGVGLAAAFYPALRASRLNPALALRYL